jgi:hypothetical protein
MKRAVTLFTALAAFAVGSFASTAQAGGHEWHLPPHGHVMLIGVEVIEGEVHFDRCVEFKALRVPAHHNSIHTGKAGGSPFAQGALFRRATGWLRSLRSLSGQDVRASQVRSCREIETSRQGRAQGGALRVNGAAI